MRNYEWRDVAISEFCETGSGGTPSRTKQDEYFGGRIPWVKSGELRESTINSTEESLTESGLRSSSAKLLPPGTLLVALYGATVGRVGILGIEAATNQAVCHVIPDRKRADIRYLFHALRSKATYWLSQRVGGGQPNISQGVVKETSIHLPPLAEQRRIADVLDRAEALRAQRRAALAQLDTLTQAVFLEMFGDPARNPKKWSIRPIGDFLLSASYGSSKKAHSGPGIPMLRMNNITSSGRLDLSDLKYVELADQEVDRYTVRDGDILFNRTNSVDLVGKTAVYRSDDQMAYAGYLIRLRTREEHCPDYLAAILNSAWGKKVLRSMCKSIIGMANINATEIQSLPVMCPPPDLQWKFFARSKQLESVRLTGTVSLSELDSLFASLQHRAFRGEL